MCVGPRLTIDAKAKVPSASGTSEPVTTAPEYTQHGQTHSQLESPSTRMPPEYAYDTEQRLDRQADRRVADPVRCCSESSVGPSRSELTASM
jgi:hypothetical protein